MKNTILWIVLIVFIAGCSPKLNQDRQDKPNFIIMQADDLGWDDLQFNGNKYLKTPSLDKLANTAIEIERFYVNPVCAPTRASLLTGRDFLLTGVSHVNGGKDYINLDETTFAEVFKKEGYTTGMWGKWHSGNTDGYLPWQRGFDEAYKAKLYKHKDSEGLFNGNPVKFNKWADQVIVDYAIDFIMRNKEKPFVAYLPFLTCHSPLVARKEIINKYKKKGLSQNLSTLYAMIDQMDKEIGRLLAEVENLDLNENTYIIFMSDNGPAVINDLLSDKDRKIRYASRYKGHKGNIWENGVKSSLLISNPKMLSSEKADMLCDVTDIFPTIAELAGIDIGKYKLELTGKSFAKNILNKTYSRPDKIVFNYADRGWPPTDKAWTPKGVKDEYLPEANNKELIKYEHQIISVINDDYKLMKNSSKIEADISDDDGYVLISIKDDILEDNNIAGEKKEVFSKMKNVLQKKYTDIVNSPNAFKPIVFNIAKNSENTVLLFAPSIISTNLKIAAGFSYPWNKKGSFSDYKINSKNDFIASPVITKKGNASGINYLIEIDGYKSKSISQNDSEIIFEKIKISAGKKIIRISVTNSMNNTNEIQIKKLKLLN